MMPPITTNTASVDSISPTNVPSMNSIVTSLTIAMGDTEFFCHEFHEFSRIVFVSIRIIALGHHHLRHR